MRYLNSILRIIVLVAVVLAIANFSDVKKVKAAASFDPATCTVSGTNIIAIPFSFPAATCEGKDVTITGNGTGDSLIVEITGTHTFSNLKITDGARLTHPAIVPGDIDTGQPINDPNYLKASGQIKKVDLNITGTLTITNQARIDVSGRGFPGGNAAHPFGYGPGTCNGTNDCWGQSIGGGSYGGVSCSYNDGESCHADHISSPFYGDSDITTVYNGSGGTYDSYHGGSIAGGGTIKINTVNMYFDQNDQTFIASNGGEVKSIIYGGAGGSIVINATNLTTSYSSVTGQPSASGGGGSSPFGYPGTVVTSPLSLLGGKYIVANGLGRGAGGGRIKVTISSPVSVDCRITAGDQIPAVCENQDVTVSGTTVNMNKVPIGTDSKRKFTNLTVENNGVITHEALTRADLEAGGKTVNRTSGTGRWKKVDIEVADKITLKSGGKIDVTGKGYPGAYFSWDETGDIGDQGCSGDHIGFLVGADGISLRSDTVFYTNYGFGPGGGIAYNNYNGADGGGGSFAGAGKLGTEEKALPRVQSDYKIGTNLDWGSGGGAGSDDGGGADTACANGGAGGGIIDLKANDLVLGSAKGIIADGAPGILTPIYDGNTIGSGGGSGGVVRLSVNSISQNFVFVLLQSGANQYVGASPADGRVEHSASSITVNKSSTPQISVLGGNGIHVWHGGDGYGSGGGGGWIVLGAGTTASGPDIQSKKIEVTVTWKENGIDKTVKLYSVLRSVVPAP